jgi:predicted nucleotidyltransferase
MAAVIVDDKLIKYITDTIVEHFHPRRIILFGSRARGEARADSDVDLLVEMESEKDFYQRGYELELLFSPRNWSMDLLAYTPEEIEQQKDWSFFRQIWREGKVLYERS